VNSSNTILINLSLQCLDLLESGRLIKRYSVSTAKNGAGQGVGSECTPLGRHLIQDKFGEGCPKGTVFVGREPTGEIYSRELSQIAPDRDWILTRILWLAGTEPGLNQGGDRDTYNRYIYIHGCPDSEPLGTPLSHGCIRMRNADVMELFDLVDKGTEVEIQL